MDGREVEAGNRPNKRANHHILILQYHAHVHSNVNGAQRLVFWAWAQCAHVLFPQWQVFSQSFTERYASRTKGKSQYGVGKGSKCKSRCKCEGHWETDAAATLTQNREIKQGGGGPGEERIDGDTYKGEGTAALALLRSSKLESADPANALEKFVPSAKLGDCAQTFSIPTCPSKFNGQ